MSTTRKPKKWRVKFGVPWRRKAERQQPAGLMKRGHEGRRPEEQEIEKAPASIEASEDEDSDDSGDGSDGKIAKMKHWIGKSRNAIAGHRLAKEA